MSLLEKLRALVNSRRFWTTVASVVEVALHDVLGLTLEQAVVVAGILQSWVVGDSLKKTLIEPRPKSRAGDK